MDPPSVYIEKEPLLDMMLGSVETFKRECFGYIFGRKPSRSRNEFVITNAIAVQLAKHRKNQEIEQSRASRNRMYEIFQRYSKLYPVFGDFHSHPAWGKLKGIEYPTEDRDLPDMIRRQEEVELSIIICISSRNREKLIWQHNPSGSIKGSLHNYVFTINAFRLVKDENNFKAQALVVRAPSALRALNTAIKRS